VKLVKTRGLKSRGEHRDRRATSYNKLLEKLKRGAENTEQRRETGGEKGASAVERSPGTHGDGNVQGE